MIWKAAAVLVLLCGLDALHSVSAIAADVASGYIVGVLVGRWSVGARAHP